ncbi:glycoside hydrolase family 3 N-terminal domain-containing protein [Robertmurraya sp. DFI.2.37]|uniref:glycoside hydrolase family 3 N-terminal domain-containing protein n=1 Tax=Robertmurraya sp. DFI.2.37 TaxID=3031819 RepID=UPI0012471D8C|nr:glycoside hydrolase family 3 N-terminal domain-containing protein [Robertmurraya sp. DFI.2.37]MDF1509427.1 glycoside hydrolase family 3 N-terminal domain-containing protein [Robertmurraya sp. DFI.2.37]
MEKTEKVKMSKKKRNILIALSALVVLLGGILLYGFVITSSGYWLLAKFKPDTEEQKLSYSTAIESIEKITDEGFVLMQNNDNLLPIKTSEKEKAKINVFGTRSVVTLFNSGGSTATDVTSAVKLEDALQSSDGNFELNQDLLYLHYNFYKKGKVSIEETSAPKNKSDSEILGEATNLILPEIPKSAYEDTSLYNDGKSLIDHAKEFSDTAMIVVGRGGGEMVELGPKELQLTAEEKDMVDVVGSNFENVILVINSANVMELDFLKDYPAIKSVIWIGYPGETGTKSLARILNGKVNPSGHLVDTWIADVMSMPAANNYMEIDDDGKWSDSLNHYTNAPEEFGYFNQLHEGIYVGYKYYETRHATDESYNYDADVVFPFGHGLSYTTFEKEIIEMNVDDDVITLRVAVKNTGDIAGKDAIQIYYNPPYTGAIEKSTVNLVEFKKTNEIEPGATEIYSLEFNVEDMASYDYKENKAYVLEAGDYEIMLMDDAHTKLDSEIYALDKAIVYNDENDGKRLSDQQVATNHFDDAYHIDDYLTREWNQESRAFTGPQESDFTATQEILDAMSFELPTDKELGLTSEDMPKYGQNLDKTIMLSDMVDVEYDDPKWDEFLSQLTLEEMTNLSGTGAYQLLELERLGVPKTLQPDGSMAIASNIYSGPIMGVEGVGVTYPSPGITAATWNQDAGHLMGTSVGTEAQAFGYSGWYSPAMNIHRTPFNGRNFEYYSEDGVLSGKIAAQVVKGATDKGVITYIKHFALNEREKGVRNQLFTWSNEQAIREIYLKPFELAVKEGGSLGVMSSFNYIGLTWAGGHEGLLTEVLRNEWGFKGLVITDANMYGHMNVLQMLQAGGDVTLDAMAVWQGGAGQNKDMLEAAQNPETEINMTKNLYRASKNVLYAVSRTWKMDHE